MQTWEDCSRLANKAPAGMMDSPQAQRQWVGMLALMVVVEFPVVLQKCIFDEVQAQVGVVQSAPIQARSSPSGLPKSSIRSPTWQETRPPGGGALPLRYLSQRQRRRSVPPVHASPQPIRIHSWISKGSSDLSEVEKGRLEAAVREAVRMVSSLLSVNRILGPLLLSRDINKYCKFVWRNSSSTNYNRCGRASSNYRSETCLDVTIPDDHLAGCHIYPEADSPLDTELRPDGAGLPDTDFLLYLHVQTTDKCRAEPNVLAYAYHCRTDTSGRPVAGVVVICSDRLLRATYRSTVQTVIHELFHILGFSKHLFHTWSDCSSTSPGAADCSPWGKVIHSDGSGQMRIYSPSVILGLQKHLGSNDPELGAPLENLDVPPGTVSSHWESRVLRGSIMTAVLGNPTAVRIDPITLAALQDTGWYTVNLSGAQTLVWGKGEGGLFGSLSTCQDKSSSFFCTGSGFGCHYLHLHKGECQTNQYLEGCGVYEPLKNGSECWEGENGKKLADQNQSGEIFGVDSRCFFSNLTRQSQFVLLNGSVEGRCYRHRCTGPNRYQIQVSGSGWLDCPDGGAIQVKGYRGLVSCPNKRLCLHADVVPPSENVATLPTSVTSDPYETSHTGQNGTWPPSAVSAALWIAAAATGLLAAVMVSCMKCCSCGVRIHSTPVDPNDL